MNRIILSIMTCLAFFGYGKAQITDVTVGYCGGEMPEKGTVSCPDKDTWVSAAIYIPASTLNTYAGNRITGINAALASKLNIEELKVWVRKDLNGENLVEKSITTTTDRKITKKWNEVIFDTPYEITVGDDGLFIGYSFYQTKKTVAVASLSYPTENGFFYQFGDAAWEDHSSEGTLCVEARVQGDNLPRVNLTLLKLNVPEVYIIDRGVMTVSGTVWNRATHTVTGFDVNAYVDGVKMSTSRVEMELPYNQTADFQTDLALGISEVGSGKGMVTVTVDNIAEGADENPDDNSLSAEFAIVQRDFRHRILVEEFTTEKCTNCPRVGNFIHDALERDEYKDDVIVVCHHAGYETDWLTTSFDRQYLRLFNGSTYAPGISYDRDANGTDTAVSCPELYSDLDRSMKKALANPAFVSVNIKTEVDPTDENHIIVKVEGAKSRDVLCENPTVTVWVVEDNIAAKSQKGASRDWVHQHVNRAVNTAWGDPIEFDGDNYTYGCEFNLMSEWKRDDIQIVAFVANYNPDNILDCEVQNTSAVKFVNSGNAVTGVESDSDSEVEIFTISGMRVNGDNLAPGVYIRKAGSQTSKFIVR